MERKAKNASNSDMRVKILTPILRTFWFEMFVVSQVKLIASTLVFVNPLVLDRLISFMTPTNDEPQWRGFFYASLMFISPLFESILNNQYEYRVNLVCMKIRAALITVIYNKVTNNIRLAVIALGFSEP